MRPDCSVTNNRPPVSSAAVRYVGRTKPETSGSSWMLKEVGAGEAAGEAEKYAVDEACGAATLVATCEGVAGMVVGSGCGRVEDKVGAGAGWQPMITAR